MKAKLIISMMLLLALVLASIATVAANPAWNIETVDSAGYVVRDTSIALDASGYPHISYFDDTNVDLKYAKWTGSAWSKETVDSAGYVGRYTSIALDASGYPHISYFDCTNSDLKYATEARQKPDLVITEKWLCWPDNCTICYNVTNTGTGTAPACHNTALYVDDVAVAHDHVPVDLAPGERYIGYFDDYTWTYTSPSDNITVCADNNETLDELDETNNCLTNIWMCGDVNCDGKVTMSDVRKVFNRYLDQNYPLDLLWAADVNCNGKVTMSDVRKVFNRYLDPGYGLNCCCKGVG